VIGIKSKTTGVAKAAVLKLLESVTAFFIGIMLFYEYLSVKIAIGGCAILPDVLLVIISKNRKIVRMNE